MSDIFPSLPEELDMGVLLGRFPKGIRALCDYHDHMWGLA